MTAKLLAKLTPKGLQIEGAGGGVVEISQMDIAGSLGMGNLDPWAYKYTLAKWCDDDGYVSEVRHYLPHFLRSRWGDSKLSVKDCDGVAFIALLQTLGGYHCPHCLGRGHVNYKPCPKCNGTGTGAFRQTDKARFIGNYLKGRPISRQAYQKTWDPRVREAEILLGEWEQQGLRHLYRQWREVA